jgi:hypothetical protein
MARKKRQAFQQKLRTREHVIAELAVNHVERQALLCGFSVERIIHDYGLDLILFTYNADGELEDGSVFLQVKAREQVVTLQGEQEIAFRVARADVQTWLRRRMPVILIVYDVAVEVAYWLYVQRYFAQLTGFDVTKAATTLTLRLPTGQTLTPDAVRRFAGFRDSILGQIGRVDHA